MMRMRFLAWTGLLAALLAAPLARAEAAGEVVPAEGPADGRPHALPYLDGKPLVGRWACLSGLNSRPGKSPIERYEWRQLKGPPLRFFDAQQESPRVWTFLERPGEYHLILRARNAQGWCPFVALEFTVTQDTRPDPSPDLLMPMGLGEKIALSGEGWKQVYGESIEQRRAPDGSETVLRLVKPGLYLFEALHAGDLPMRRGYLLPPDKDGLLGDRRPLAKLPAIQTVSVGQKFTLDGSLSLDPDGDALTARWLMPETEGMELLHEKELAATFFPRKAGYFRVQLVVSDGKLDAVGECYVTVQDAPEGEPEPGPAAPEPAAPDPWPRDTTVGLFEADLDRAVQLFPSRAGVTLRVASEFLPPEKLNTVPLHLAIRNGPTRLLLDWIARQTGAPYVLETPTAVWLTKIGHTVNPDPVSNVVFAADALYDDGQEAEFLNLLRVCCRGALGGGPEASLTLEPKSKRIIAFLPKSVAERLKEVLLHMRTPKGLGLLPPPPFDDEERWLRAQLGLRTVSLDWEGRRLDLALRDLAERSGFAVGFDPRQFDCLKFTPDYFARKLPKLTLKRANVPLRQAVRDLCEAAGFDGCQPERGGGLWFYKGKPPYPSGASLRETARVGSYDLSGLLPHFPLLSGEAIAHEVRQRVYPDSWADPFTACVYHKATEKLIVIHGHEAHRGVLRTLYDLAQRGENALGQAPEE